MFSAYTFKFLTELADNNNREWFDLNRPRYEHEVREPAFEYIRAMQEPIAFSKDKTPYKTNIGIQFRHAAGKDVHAPGFYLNIAPGEIFLAAGIWAPDNPTLHKVRTLIDDYPNEWKKLARNLTNKKTGFSFHEGSLKKAPKGFSNDHPLLEDLKRKHFVVARQIAKRDIQGKSAAANTAALFKKAAPLVQFICEANELDF